MLNGEWAQLVDPQNPDHAVEALRGLGTSSGDLIVAEQIVLRVLRKEGRSDVADAYEQAIGRMCSQRWR